MKRLLLSLLVLIFMAGAGNAVQTYTEIIDETLSISNPVAEADGYIADSDKVTFFMTINNNRTTAAVTAGVTVAYSVDGVNWHDISWLDVAGGVTPQTSETTTAAEQVYVGWIDNRLIGKYIRLRIKSGELESNYDSRFTADDNAAVTVTIVENK